MSERPDRGGKRTRTVLVAEDDASVSAFVTAALRQAGYTVVAAPDGRAAGALFAADPHRFDVILTDVMMPYVLGTEFAAHARELRPDVPVVFMSAFPGGPGRAPEPLPENVPLLGKPFTVPALLAALGAA